MTTEDLTERLQSIRLSALDGDTHAAMAEESQLYEDALELIASGHPNAAKLAAQVLEAKEMRRKRWAE